MPIHGYPGNIITANPTAPTSSVASGVWTTEQQLQAKAAGNWPFTIPTQQISRSLRFNSADSAYLNRTPASAGNRKTWTWSGWVKRSALGTEQILFGAYDNSSANDSTYTGIFLGAGNTLALSGWTVNWRVTTQVFRDASAWYHIVVALDTTQATANNRVKIYVNGVEVTAFGTTNNPTQNADLGINATNQHGLGRINYLTGSGPYYFNGYLTEINFIDGQALTPSSFGQTNASTGVWEPIAYTGTYGTNGFYVNFSDNSGTTATTLGKDYSGNGNNWTPNNFSVTAGAGNDSLVDTPTPYGTDTGAGGEVRGNYCTLNPLDIAVNTLSNGNLTLTNTSISYGACRATLAIPTTGKWYWEINVTAQDTSTASWFSVGMMLQTIALNQFLGSTAGVIYYGDRNDESDIYNGTTTVYGPGSAVSFVTGDVLKCAYDADTGKFWFGKNSSWWDSSAGTTGNPSAGTNQTLTAAAGTYVPFIQLRNYGTNTADVNFGQRAFSYTAPSGFKALCTQNLPTPTIGATSTTQANRYMDIKLYTGNGGQQTQTGLNLQPDFIWVKSRSNAYDNGLANAVTGTGKYLVSNSAAAEVTDASGSIIAFNANGFGQGGSNPFGANAATYVAWCWRASNAAGVTNTAGTITSTVSANTTSGFSIVTYTGNGSTSSTQTIGHGLGVKPAFIITKYRSGSVPAGGDYWSCWHKDLGGTNAGIWLNLSNGRNNSMWSGQGSISSTVFVPADLSYNNVNGVPYINYVFAPVEGYSAFGSYTGNGSDDGPFIYTGFRPRFIMTKAATVAGEWEIYDTARGTYNSVSMTLEAQASSAELNYYTIDILSNGFKQRRYYNTQNQSGQTFIYAAFAESPFKYSLAR